MSKFRELLVRIVWILVVVVVPILFWISLFEYYAYTNAEQKIHTQKFWVPDDCVVITDPEERNKKYVELQNRDLISVDNISIERYMNTIGTEKSYVVLLFETRVEYYVQQGKLLVCATRTLDSPNFVSIKLFRYQRTGGSSGQIEWEVERSNVGVTLALISGLLVGLLTGAGLVIVVCITYVFGSLLCDLIY